MLFPIDATPVDALREVLAHCEFRSLVALRLTSRHYHQLATDELIARAQRPCSAVGCSADAEISHNVTWQAGWGPQHTKEGVMEEALRHANPGGEVSWAPYDHDKGWRLMRWRGSVDVIDFDEEGIANTPFGDEVGWKVWIVYKSHSMSRTHLLERWRELIGDYKDACESENDYDKVMGELQDVWQSVWSLLLEKPTQVILSGAYHEYRSTDYGSTGFTVWMYIHTPRGKKFELVWEYNH